MAALKAAAKARSRHAGRRSRRPRLRSRNPIGRKSETFAATSLGGISQKIVTGRAAKSKGVRVMTSVTITK
ncbi:hypothetical protein D3C83_22410 [compost metagenome]